MADSIGNFLSTIKQNIPYLKDHEVTHEVALGIVMHLFIFICFITLFSLLVIKFI